MSSEAVQVLPPTELVGGGTWAIALPQPVRSVPWAFVYLVQDADDALHLIDSGWKSDENWDLLVSEVAALGFDISDVATLTISHLHQDHLGLGKRLREATGARLMMHRAEQESIDRLHAGDVAAPDWVAWGVPEEQGAALVKAIGMNVPEDAPADVLLEDGDTLPYAGREFRVAHTPGHTPGSICIVVADEKLIFTGDHVLPTVNSGLGLGGSHIGALADAVASYDRMQAFADFTALPGHEFHFDGVGARAEALKKHHLTRSREVAAALAANPDATVWEIAKSLTWSQGFENLGMFLASALAQTEMNMDFVRSGGLRNVT